jgi:hypothetical protein
MIESIETRWRSLLRAPEPGMREVSATSPLRMAFGVNEQSRPYAFVMPSRPPRAPQLSSSVEVEIRRRTDGLWTLTLSLLDESLTDAFVTLMSGILDDASRASSERVALDSFFRRLDELRHLLVPRRERLSLEALRGLVAELWFGFLEAPHGHALEVTVASWNGPFGSDQDFSFPSPAPQIEVKSVHVGRSEVEISSARQLDRDDLLLAVVTLENVPAAERGTISLPRIVGTIRERCETQEREAFNRRLVELGVNMHDQWYGEQHFRVRRLALFAVGQGFPRLAASELPPSIVGATYRLDVSTLGEFLVLESDFGSEGEAQ